MPNKDKNFFGEVPSGTNATPRVESKKSSGFKFDKK